MNKRQLHWETHAPVALDAVLQVINHAHATDVPATNAATGSALFPAVHRNAGAAGNDFELLVARQGPTERNDARSMTKEHDGPDFRVLGLDPGEEGRKEDFGPIMKVLERLTLPRRVVRRLVLKIQDTLWEEGRQRRGRPRPRMEGCSIGRRERVPLSETVLEL